MSDGPLTVGGDCDCVFGCCDVCGSELCGDFVGRASFGEALNAKGCIDCIISLLSASRSSTDLDVKLLGLERAAWSCKRNNSILNSELCSMCTGKWEIWKRVMFFGSYYRLLRKGT